ncbi:MAG: hypothetical protein HYW91_01230 [Candidatus Sungbacteria bacterium]|nr:hypothetical protein [Candidatus Sungbacteria bacterium]
MRKWLERAILMGYVIQIPAVIAITLLVFVVQFFDNFYNKFLLEPILGRNIRFAGFLVSMAVALLLGFIAETKRGWRLVSHLGKVPLAGQIVNVIEQWKKFRSLARSKGVILAPYYRGASSFAPGVVTGVIPIEDGGHIITVVFGDMPIPKPLGLTEHDIIYASLSLNQAISYMLSGGLALKILEKKLRRMTLGEYVRSNPDMAFE